MCPDTHHTALHLRYPCSLYKASPFHSVAQLHKETSRGIMADKGQNINLQRGVVLIMPLYPSNTTHTADKAKEVCTNEGESAEILFHLDP